MDKIEIREKVLNYLDYYNRLDIDSMVSLLDKNLIFKNIVENEVNVLTKGIEEFRELALNSASLFEKREQTMITIAVEENTASVEIFFNGILAKDLPSGAFKGDEIRIEGYSEFEFNKDGLIKSISDFS